MRTWIQIREDEKLASDRAGHIYTYSRRFVKMLYPWLSDDDF